MKWGSLFAVSLIVSCSNSRAEDWPEFRGLDRAGVWNAGGGLVENFEGMPHPLPRVWTAEVSAGYSGPTVAGDSVYVMDRGGPGDEKSNLERVVCVNRETGDLRWVFPYEAPYTDVGYAYGPRSSVTVVDGKTYSLGVMGHLNCLDAKTGTAVWSKDLRADYNVDMPI